MVPNTSHILKQLELCYILCRVVYLHRVSISDQTERIHWFVFHLADNRYFWVVGKLDLDFKTLTDHSDVVSESHPMNSVSAVVFISPALHPELARL